MKTLKTILFVAILAIATNSLFRSNAGTPDMPVWEIISESTTATVYNATEQQCGQDFLHTASNHVIDLSNIEGERIVAMERTMMQEFDINYGDKILVEGTGVYDGVWNVQDTMHKKYKGQHRIDFLVPENISYGKWENIIIYKQVN